MSGVKHTPGRWTFDNRSMTGAVWAEKEFVASVYPNAPKGWDGASDYERLDEMRANARLIAAAPELLAVARLALKTILDAAEARDFDPPADPILIAELEAAIAKATAGETRNAEGAL